MSASHDPAKAGAALSVAETAPLMILLQLQSQNEILEWATNNFAFIIVAPRNRITVSCSISWTWTLVKSLFHLQMTQLGQHNKLLQAQQSVIEEMSRDMKRKDRLIDDVLRAGGQVLDMLSGSTEAERKQIAEIFNNRI